MKNAAVRFFFPEQRHFYRLGYSVSSVSLVMSIW